MPLRHLSAGCLAMVIAAVGFGGSATTEGRPQAPGPAVGTIMPDLQGYDLDGLAVTITYANVGKPTVIYNVLPSPFVYRNEANFAELVRQARSRFRFVIVSYNPSPHPLREDFAAYMARVKPTWGETPVPIVRDIPLSRAQVNSLGLGGYPHTLVVSEESRIIKVFAGAYAATGSFAHLGEVETFFGVKLPGLLPVGPTQ